MRSKRSQSRLDKRNEEREKCQQKVRYESKKYAQTALNTLIANQGKEGQRRIYSCPWCKGWHMTHVERENKKVQDIKLIMEDKWKQVLNQQEQ